MDIDTVRKKKENLVSNLKKMDSLVVAFSGGVDSTFLLAMALEALGSKVIAATANSVIHQAREIEHARSFTKKNGIRHIVFSSEEMDDTDFLRNDKDRCYHCKRLLVQMLSKIADQEGIKHIAHGANADDLGDYRPGFRAADEAGMIAPLINAELNKEEIRFLSRETGLPTWDKSAMACLASRIPYGVHITEERLNMVDKAENFLLENGIKEVRVRHHGSVARIEVGRSEIKTFLAENFRRMVTEKFREIGFEHVSLDLEGYISGKMNRELGENRQEI